MTFDRWLSRLRDRGFVLCPASSAVPVDVRCLTPTGVGLHFRCRGVRVRLAVYRPGRAAWQVPLRDEDARPEETLELWQHRPVDLAEGAPSTGARLTFTGDPDPPPDREAMIDGSLVWGWCSHEAGLLRPREAAPLLELLLIDAGLDSVADPAATDTWPGVERVSAGWNGIGDGGRGSILASARLAVPLARSGRLRSKIYSG